MTEEQSNEIINWKPGQGPSDAIARMPPGFAAEMAPLIAAQDAAGLEALVQRVFGPIGNSRSFTFKNERTGTVAARSVAGVWSFSESKKQP